VPTAREPEDAEPDDFATGPGLLRRHLSTTIATALWAAAAVLSILAPFRAFYTLHYGPTDLVGVDGWGRVLTGPNAAPASHAARFGVPIVIGGSVCGLLALWIAVQAWRGTVVGPRIATRLVPALGLLAGGVVIGAAFGAWETYASQRDAASLQTRLSVLSDGVEAPASGPGVRLGAFVLLAFFAGLCAVLGALAAAMPAEPSSPADDVAEPALEDEPDDQDGPTVVADTVVRTDGDEELLGS
jgi:hypothetical protein